MTGIDIPHWKEVATEVIEAIKQLKNKTTAEKIALEETKIFSTFLLQIFEGETDEIQEEILSLPINERFSAALETYEMFLSIITKQKEPNTPTHMALTEDLLRILNNFPNTPPDQISRKNTLEQQLHTLDDTIPHLFTEEFNNIQSAILNTPPEKRYAAALEVRQLLRKALNESKGELPHEHL